MSDLISREAAIEVLTRLANDPWNQETNASWAAGFSEAAYIIENLPSAQPDLLDGLKIIEQFLQSCKDSLTCEIIAPNGMKLHTDWGYFVEGLEELRRYAERRTDETD